MTKIKYSDSIKERLQFLLEEKKQGKDIALFQFQEGTNAFDFEMGVVSVVLDILPDYLVLMFDVSVDIKTAEDIALKIKKYLIKGQRSKAILDVFTGVPTDYFIPNEALNIKGNVL